METFAYVGVMSCSHADSHESSTEMGFSPSLGAITCNTYLCTSLQDLRNSMDGSTSGFLMAATNFREVDNSELEVYRIKFVDESSESSILSNVHDRGME